MKKEGMALGKKYKDFMEKRMFIFNELKRWSGELSTAEDLEELALFIRNKYGFSDEMPFIKIIYG